MKLFARRPGPSAADEVRAVLDVLKTAGVAKFEGLGINVEFQPPPTETRAPVASEDPAVAKLRHLTAMLGGGR